MADAGAPEPTERELLAELVKLSRLQAKHLEKIRTSVGLLTFVVVGGVALAVLAAILAEGS